MHEEFDLIAGEGTRLIAWSNGHDEGMPVLIHNGRGVPPEACSRGPSRYLGRLCVCAMAALSDCQQKIR